MLSNLIELALYEPVNHELTRIANMLSGGQGATATVLKRDYNESQVLDAQTLRVMATDTIEMGGLRSSDPTLHTRLMGYVENQTPLLVAGRTLDGFLITSGNFVLSMSPGFQGNPMSWRIKITSEGLHGYGDDGCYGTRIDMVKNALALFKWADNSGDGIADGYNLTNLKNPSFTGNDQQQITHYNSDTRATMDRVIFFPFPSVTVTIAISADSISTGAGITGYTDEVGVEAEDGYSTFLGSSKTGLAIGRPYTSYKLPNNTIYVRCLLVDSTRNAGSGERVFTVRDPSVQLKGGTAITNY